jgi:hypothetical protein
MAEFFGKICEKYLVCHYCNNYIDKKTGIAYLNLYICDECKMPIIIIPSSRFGGQLIQSRLISFQDKIIYHPHNQSNGEIEIKKLLFKEPLANNFIYFDGDMKYTFNIDSEYFEILQDNIKNFLFNENSIDKLVETAINIANSGKYEKAFNIMNAIKNKKYVEISNFYQIYSTEYIKYLNNKLFEFEW